MGSSSSKQQRNCSCCYGGEHRDRLSDSSYVGEWINGGGMEDSGKAGQLSIDTALYGSKVRTEMEENQALMKTSSSVSSSSSYLSLKDLKEFNGMIKKKRKKKSCFRRVLASISYCFCMDFLFH
ncbi:hypothetical protein ACHQM5_029034 [Ranunculus cassubicifolius]